MHIADFFSFLVRTFKSTPLTLRRYWRKRWVRATTYGFTAIFMGLSVVNGYLYIQEKPTRILAQKALSINQTLEAIEEGFEDFERDDSALEKTQEYLGHVRTLIADCNAIQTQISTNSAKLDDQTKNTLSTLCVELSKVAQFQDNLYSAFLNYQALDGSEDPAEVKASLAIVIKDLESLNQESINDPATQEQLQRLKEQSELAQTLTDGTSQKFNDLRASIIKNQRYTHFDRINFWHKLVGLSGLERFTEKANEDACSQLKVAWLTTSCQRN